MRIIKILVLTVFLLLPGSVSVESKTDDGEGHPHSKIIDAERLIKDIKYLSSDKLKGRETGSIESALTRKYVIKRFKKSGLKRMGAKYTQEFSFKTRSDKTINGVNVIGLIKGKANPEKYIVVTAHYDHVGFRSGKIYNGADDNASGTAALFALAKYFKKIARNIR